MYFLPFKTNSSFIEKYSKIPVSVNEKNNKQKEVDNACMNIDYNANNILNVFSSPFCR